MVAGFNGAGAKVVVEVVVVGTAVVVVGVSLKVKLLRCAYLPSVDLALQAYTPTDSSPTFLSFKTDLYFLLFIMTPASSFILCPSLVQNSWFLLTMGVEVLHTNFKLLVPFLDFFTSNDLITCLLVELVALRAKDPEIEI